MQVLDKAESTMVEVENQMLEGEGVAGLTII